jgi:hypothetical protein
MFLPLRVLITLGIATVTKDGNIVINCSTIRVIKCTYKGCVKRITDGAITITLPKTLQSIAPEQLCEQDIGLVIDIDLMQSRNPDIKAMAELTTAPMRHTVPAPVLENGVLTVTICVTSSDASNLPQDATNIIIMGEATSAQVTIKPDDVTNQGEGRYSLNLPDGRVLWFTFHREIEKDALDLLQKARVAADEAEGRAYIMQRKQKGLEAVARDSRPRPNGNTQCVEPNKSANGISHGLFDGKDGDVESPEDWIHNAYVAPASDAPAAPASAAEAQRLKEAEEAEETQRLEQQHTTNIHDAPDIMVLPVCAKTYDPMVGETILSIGHHRGLELQWTEQQHEQGIAYFIEVSPLLVAGILTMRVSAWGNELIVGELTDDGTLRWGTCANVWNGSYGAVVSMFPAMSVTVQQVVKTRAILKIQKQPQHQQRGFLPVPEPTHFVPVCDALGNVVTYHQAPPFAHQHLQQELLPNPGLVCVMPVCDTWGRFVGFQQVPSFA